VPVRPPVDVLAQRPRKSLDELVGAATVVMRRKYPDHDAAAHDGLEWVASDMAGTLERVRAAGRLTSLPHLPRQLSMRDHQRLRERRRLGRLVAVHLELPLACDPRAGRHRVGHLRDDLADGHLRVARGPDRGHDRGLPRGVRRRRALAEPDDRDQFEPDAELPVT